MCPQFKDEGIVADHMSITILGEAGTGKTSIVNRLQLNIFSNSLPLTLGAEYSYSRVVVNNSPVDMRICDIAGQNFSDALKRNYMRNSQGALLVFDLTEPRSISNLPYWLSNYLAANNSDHKLPILLVGNKLDLYNERRITISEVRRFLNFMEVELELKTNIVGFIETSAKSGEGVRNVFSTLSRHIIKM